LACSGSELIVLKLMNRFRHLVGLFGLEISPTQGQHNTEKHGHASMTRVVFESTIPAFERPKTVRALDRTAIGTG